MRILRTHEAWTDFYEGGDSQAGTQLRFTQGLPGVDNGHFTLDLIEGVEAWVATVVLTKDEALELARRIQDRAGAIC